mmetsp:Transcript_4608/g.15385  ORF Transcript_4608/g.15385 Transcript_4608/m.15385 type:complete len:109 (+) Transcript_4608:363-689(+)
MSGYNQISGYTHGLHCPLFGSSGRPEEEDEKGKASKMLGTGCQEPRHKFSVAGRRASVQVFQIAKTKRNLTHWNMTADSARSDGWAGLVVPPNERWPVGAALKALARG